MLHLVLFDMQLIFRHNQPEHRQFLFEPLVLQLFAQHKRYCQLGLNLKTELSGHSFSFENLYKHQRCSDNL